ncbi:hypothetical protein BP6252_03459 [Coleophoma cylindrospora]|uniref:DUF6594 domain-containing protein n=1 Tax=Coleophoma cylindrospora TaxID=1849047 RepID=A0A3D8S7Q4_9HELO|nr:hypothetical protein BP6252_03459 [Coleophoma cylindrospora]
MTMTEGKYINNKLYDAAEFMAYDPDFLVFKRFDRLNYYNLLRLQRRLKSLDEQIAPKLTNGPDDEIEKLALQIGDTLKQYNDGLLAEIQLSKLRAPAPRVLDVIRTFLSPTEMNNEVALKIFHVDKEDSSGEKLVQLVDVEKTWGHQFVDRHSSLRKLFEKPSPNPYLMLYSEDGVRKVVRLFVPLIFAILLLGPICGMNYLNHNSQKLGVLIACVLGVSVVIACCTKARDWEMLTITAA